MDSSVTNNPPAIQEEEKSKGAISSKIYYNYVRAGSGAILMSAMILSTIISQCIFHYTDVWLSQWYLKLIFNPKFQIQFEHLLQDLSRRCGWSETF